MTISRAARGLLALAIFLVATLVDTTAGHAQGSVPVTLTLVSQTPWSTLKDPMLDLAIRADNAGADAIGDLTLGIRSARRSARARRTETSLTAGPELPIFAATLPEKDAVEAGGTRRFRTSVDLSTIGGISRTDSLVYPMRIDLRTAGVQVAVVDTPVIVVVRAPEVPLLVSTTIELTAPPALDPDGRLAAFEASIAPGGSLSAQVTALDRLASGTRVSPVDLVIQPSLLDQLSQMDDGYERADGSTVEEGADGAARAAAILAELRHVVSSALIHLSMPFSAP
jgi:hypothetical protein